MALVTTGTPIQVTASPSPSGSSAHTSALTPSCQPRESAQLVCPPSSLLNCLPYTKCALPVTHALHAGTIVSRLQNPDPVHIGMAGYFVLGSLSCQHVPTANYCTMAVHPMNTCYGPGIAGGHFPCFIYVLQATLR